MWQGSKLRVLHRVLIKQTYQTETTLETHVIQTQHKSNVSVDQINKPASRSASASLTPLQERDWSCQAGTSTHQEKRSILKASLKKRALLSTNIFPTQSDQNTFVFTEVIYLKSLRFPELSKGYMWKWIKLICPSNKCDASTSCM